MAMSTAGAERTLMKSNLSTLITACQTRRSQTAVSALLSSWRERSSEGKAHDRRAGSAAARLSSRRVSRGWRRWRAYCTVRKARRLRLEAAVGLMAKHGRAKTLSNPAGSLARTLTHWRLTSSVRRTQLERSRGAPVRMRSSLLRWHAFMCSAIDTEALISAADTRHRRNVQRTAWRLWWARTSPRETDMAVWLRAMVARRSWERKSAALDALRACTAQAAARRERTRYALHLRRERRCALVLRHWAEQALVAEATHAQVAADALEAMRAAALEVDGLRAAQEAMALAWARQAEAENERTAAEAARFDVTPMVPSPLIGQGAVVTSPPTPLDEAILVWEMAEEQRRCNEAATVFQKVLRARSARMVRKRLQEEMTEQMLMMAAAEAEENAAATARAEAEANAALRVRSRRYAHRDHAALAAAAAAEQAEEKKKHEAVEELTDKVPERKTYQRILARGWRRWRSMQVVHRARMLRLRAASDIADNRRRRAGLSAFVVHMLQEAHHHVAAMKEGLNLQKPEFALSQFAL